MWMTRFEPSGSHDDGAYSTEVVADADHEVRPVEPGQHVVARLEPDRHQRQVRPIVDRALAHERHGHRDVQPARKRPQLRRGAAPQDAVAGQDRAAAREPAMSRAAWSIASSVGSGK